MMRLPIKTLAVAALTAGALVAAPAAFAADSEVSQAVGGGALSASVTGGDLPGITTSHSERENAASTQFTLSADDLTGTADGWTVTQQVTDFVYSGDNNGTAIPAVNFSITPGTVTATDGSLEGVAPGPGGTLAVAKAVLIADADSGVGSYTQANDATLIVPADSMVGTYTGTLTTTISVQLG